MLNRGYERSFLFCASVTEGTMWEKEVSLLLRVTKAAEEEIAEAIFSDTLEIDR